MNEFVLAALAKLRGLMPSGYHNLIKVMGGNLTRNGLRGLFKLLVAAFLVPQGLGILRSIYSLFKIVTSLTDLGLDYALVTFVAAALRREDDEQRDRVLQTVLLLKTWVTVGLLVVGNLAAPQIARWALSDESLSGWVRLLLLAVGGQLLWKYVSSYLSSHHRFGHLALYLMSAPLLMLVSLLVLVALGRFSLGPAIFINLMAPAVTALFWLPVLDRRPFVRRLWSRAEVWRIVRFSRWIYVTNVASNNRNHLNPLLLKSPRLSGSLEAGETSAGLYSFGNDLANEITIFSQSLLMVMLPTASGKPTPEKLLRYVRRSYKHMVLFLLLAASFVFVAKPFLLLLAAIKPSYLDYMPSLSVFRILYLSALFSIASIPMQTALYAIEMPHIETYLELALVALLVVGGILLIPRYGPQGAAMVVFVQRAVAFGVIFIVGWRRLARLAASGAPGSPTA